MLACLTLHNAGIERQEKFPDSSNPKTATRAGTKYDGYVQELTARMYALRATRATVGARVCVMDAVAPLVAHDAWVESHRCDPNGGRADQ